ncbi:reverse transcriptase domain-containing protein [Tanacetum coccineum]|uniref:Reverse transcriptase domain-containing protein n=1 Tax=Tanacetum coccineum TaxID=301880 RepID=A0ABQ5C8L0_9ASTR
MSDMTACLNDLNYIPLNNEQNKPNQGDIGETSNDPTQAKRNEFEELYASANKELYPGCDYFFQNVFPTAKGYKLPPSYYAIKKTFKTIRLGYESIHACVNDCFLFSGDVNKDVHFYPVCNTSRWKDSNTPGKKVPKKVLRYFSIIPRLQRLYKSSHTAKEMTWHATGKCTEPGKMQHPVDGRAWKDFDTKYPDFAAEPRNVRLGLAADGFNPFGNLKFFHAGPKSPGKDIDVYLRPLIDDLKDLWAKPGVETIDVATGLKFNMRAMVLWTINDFPARSSLSGWSGQGYRACPTCNEDTPSVRVLGKIAYVGHRRFLKKPHKWRRSLEFNGETENEDPPNEFNRDAIMTQLARLPTRVKGKHPRFGGVKIKRNVLVELNWTKRSIFYELEYWSFLTLKHNLDVMHIEKNVLESILNTLLMNEKSKDTAKARQDLKSLGIRSGLWLGQNKNGKCSKPQAAPEIDTYRAKFKSEFPDNDMKEAFPGWFGKQIRQRHVDNDPGVSESSELFALACGPSQTPISVNSCVVNGVRFVVHSRDERRTTQNSGICSPGPDGEMYYGQLEQILEFSYLSFKTVLFRVKWFDTSNKGRMKNLVIRNNITQIKANGEAFKNDQYILATQVKQCFYLEDMARRPLGWKDDPDVIHVDNSSDLALYTSLNDLEIAVLHIDGQSIDVDTPPDIIDVVDEYDDIIDKEDPIPHDLVDFNDEDLVNLDIDDGMSADVARGHGGDGGGDDLLPSHHIPIGCGGCLGNRGKGTRKPNLGGRRAGRQHTRQETRNLGLKAITDKSGPVLIQFEFGDRETLMPLGEHAAHWANYLGELVQELPLHYPSWRQVPAEQKAGVMAQIGTQFDMRPHMESDRWPLIYAAIQQHLQKIYNGKKAALKERQWIPDSNETYDLDRIRLSHPSYISKGLGSNTETGVPYTEDEIMAIVREGKQRGHIPGVGRVLPGQGTVIPPPPPCMHYSDVVKLKKREKPEIGGGGSDGRGDDEQGDDEDDDEDDS